MGHPTRAALSPSEAATVGLAVGVVAAALALGAVVLAVLYYLQRRCPRPPHSCPARRNKRAELELGRYMGRMSSYVGFTSPLHPGPEGVGWGAVLAGSPALGLADFASQLHDAGEGKGRGEEGEGEGEEGEAREGGGEGGLATREFHERLV
jgi:hypothetical protein